MKQFGCLIIGIIVLSCLWLGYVSIVTHPHSQQTELEYLWNRAKDKTTGNIIRWLIKANMNARDKNCEYLHTNNLYDVEYDIITPEHTREVQVITYGPPTYIKVGKQITLFYDLPDGGQYKLPLPPNAQIKVHNISKLDEI